MMVKDYQIPFDKDGNMLSWADDCERSLDYPKSWIDCNDFKDDLELVNITKGRSAVHCVFKSLTTGKKYNMFLHEFLKLVKGLTFHGNTYNFIKRGQNYSLEVKEIDNAQ